MTFEELLDQAIALLQRRGRLTYGALKRQFDLDDDYLADLKAELIQGQRLAVDEDGAVLVWTGGTDVSPRTAPPAPQPGAQPGALTRHARRSSPHRSRRRPLTLNAASSPSCSVTWWTRRCWRVDSIRKTSAPWSGPIKPPVPRSSSALTATLPSTSAMACWCTSAIPRPMKTRSSGLSAAGSAWSRHWGR